jgi:serine/threonine protein kinase
VLYSSKNPAINSIFKSTCPVFSVPTAFTFVFTVQNLCIVMEYVGGGNLQQWVERHGRLPEWQARCFFQQIILALHYIHKALGIAHRDIKLGNILLNDRYQIPILKLCDFGYSKSMQAASLPKTRVGTAAYISPEVARCSGTAAYDTEKADVWSSAVTLYCMLAGRYPFTGPNGRDVPLQRIKDLTAADIEEALGKLRAASPGCVGLLRAMLTLNPQLRVSIENIMQDVWFREFLPNLSAIPSPRSTRGDVQGEEEVAGVLAEAERRSEAARRGEPLCAGEYDDFEDEALEEALQEEGY